MALNAPYYTKTQVDSKIDPLKVDIQSVENEVIETNERVYNLELEVDGIADGTGGKGYPDIVTAMAVTPLPSDGTLFTVDYDNESERGIYRYDSSTVDGYVFVRSFDATGKVEEGNTEAVSGNTVYDYALAKSDFYDIGGDQFNPSSLTNGYIHSTNGSLQGTSNPDYKCTGVIPLLDGTKFIEVIGRATLAEGFRFLDASNTPIKGLDSNGDPYTTFTAHPENGRYYIPDGAVSYQANVVWNNSSIDNVQILINGSDKNELISGDITDGDEGDFYVSGKTVYEKTLVKDEVLIRETSKNLLNKDNIIAGQYLSVTTGNYQSDATSAMSPVIDVEPDTIYTISGSDLSNQKAIVFFDASNAKLKPLDVDGVEYSNYQIGSGNGTFKSPPTAVKLQYTISLQKGTSTYNETAQLEIGNSATSYEPFFSKDVIKEDYLPSNLLTTDNINNFLNKGELGVFKNGNQIIIQRILDNGKTYDTEWLIRKESENTNQSANIVSERVNGVSIKGATDDISPVYLTSRYIGGNHGWNWGRTVVSNSHGKSYADIGSLYTGNSGNEWVLAEIIDENTLYLINYTNSYGINSVPSTMNYISGGVDTSNITVNSSSSPANKYNFSKSNKSILVVNGEEITEDGYYRASTVEIHDNYDMYDLQSVANKLVELEGTFEENPQFNNLGADKAFNHSIIYRYYGNGKCLIFHNFFNYIELDIEFHSFNQSGALSDSNAKLYVPKSKPIAGTDYTLAPVYTTPSSAQYFTSEYWQDEEVYPTRFLNFNDDYGLHIGYLPFSDFDVNNWALFLNTSKKIYPASVSYNTSKHLTVGSKYSVAMFRNLIGFKGDEPYTLYDYSEINGNIYIYVDFHASGVFNLPIKEEWIGKNIEVVKKHNINNLQNIVSDSLLLISDVEENDYGYIELKLY